MKIIFATNTGLKYKECLDRAKVDNILLSFFYLKSRHPAFLENFVKPIANARKVKPNGSLVRLPLCE